MSKVNLYDIVRLDEDIPKFNLKAGMTGTAIDKLASNAWLVEFDDLEDEDGFPIAYGFFPEQLAIVTPFSETKAAQAAKVDTFSPKVLLQM